MTQPVMHAHMGGETGGSKELIPAGAVTFGWGIGRFMAAKKRGSASMSTVTPWTTQIRSCCVSTASVWRRITTTVKKNERLMLDFTPEGDSLAWAIDKIKNRLPTMLLRCEADEIARNIDQRDVDAGIPKIVAWTETKTHRKG